MGPNCLICKLVNNSNLLFWIGRRGKQGWAIQSPEAYVNWKIMVICQKNPPTVPSVVRNLPPQQSSRTLTVCCCWTNDVSIILKFPNTITFPNIAWSCLVWDQCLPRQQHYCLSPVLNLKAYPNLRSPRSDGNPATPGAYKPFWQNQRRERKCTKEIMLNDLGLRWMSSRLHLSI